ncbi:MAG: type II secretion system protein N [Alphaproteobacteria bacterium]|nr:type II secretion system protein N [Alphaproteobacteria bacterium]
MKLRLPFGPRVALGLAALAALVVTFPMRLALDALDLDARGLTAREVRGSVWSAELRGVKVRDAIVGDVEAGLSPGSLLLGTARIRLTGGALTGAIYTSPRGFGVEGVSGALPAIAALPPLPASSLTLDGLAIGFRDGVCDRAEGGARLSVAPVAGVGIGEMRATARCDGEAALLPFQADSGVATAEMRIYAAGRYALTLTMMGADAQLTNLLVAAGFRTAPTGLALTVEGSL